MQGHIPTMPKSGSGKLAQMVEVPACGDNGKSHNGSCSPAFVAM